MPGTESLGVKGTSQHIQSQGTQSVKGRVWEQHRTQMWGNTGFPEGKLPAWAMSRMASYPSAISSEQVVRALQPWAVWLWAQVQPIPG